MHTYISESKISWAPLLLDYPRTYDKIDQNQKFDI